MRGFLRLLKISQDGFETIEISKDYAGSANADAGFAINVMLTISAGSGDVVGLSVNNASNIKGVEITFKFSENS